MKGELGEAAHVGSPFAAEQRAAGAATDLRFGVMVPEHYGDAEGEYRALVSAAGLIDLSFRGLIEVSGSERLRWLNGQVTNDVSKLADGEARLAAVLEVKGHVLSDLLVYGRSETVWLELNRDRALPVREALDRRLVADDVGLRDISAEVARLTVAGPSAGRVVAEALDPALASLPAWQHRPLPFERGAAVVLATPRLGAVGYDITVPHPAGPSLWRRFAEVGGRHGLRPVGMRALEWRRVEAGWAWYGVDLDESHLLLESLPDAYVSFTKGCYLGQEVVIRIRHQGHVNRRLVGVRLAGDLVPPPGTPLEAGGKSAGTVTSAVRSPALGRGIALAYLRREHWEPGTRVLVRVGAIEAEAEVTALPFVPEG